MEQPCYKCGQAVEEGVPFCPHCNAPQIRVVIPDPPAPPMLAAETSPSTAALPSVQTVPVLALPMRWSGALRPCALAALIGSLLMSLGLYPIVAMLGVGFLAVFFFRQRNPGIATKGVSGAGIGALAGMLWFAISSIFVAGVVLIFHKGPELRQHFLDSIQKAAAQTSDQQVIAMFDKVKSQPGFELFMLLFLCFAFVASIVLGGLGGALGASIFGRRDRT